MTVRMRYKRVRCGISAQAVSAAAALRNVRSIKMSVYKITPSLMYTGVSDTSIDLFESQYPVPHGGFYGEVQHTEENHKDEEPHNKGFHGKHLLF